MAMLACDEELLLEFIWHKKLQRICRYLLHDISNCLTGSLALSELYCDKTGVDFQEILRTIKDSCYKERGYLLLLSSLNHPQQTDAYIDLRKFIDNLQPLFQCILPAKVKVFVKNEPDTASVVKCNPEYLRRIFLQLILNAGSALQTIKEPQITFSFEQENENYICCIEDNGIGFDTTEVPSLLKNFSLQGENISSLKTGLYMVHFYMEKTGGCFKICSYKGQGTQAYLYFHTIL